MVDWISDTRSQGHTNLQSLVKCLDHMVSDPIYQAKHADLLLIQWSSNDDQVICK